MVYRRAFARRSNRYAVTCQYELEICFALKMSSRRSEIDKTVYGNNRREEFHLLHVRNICYRPTFSVVETQHENGGKLAFFVSLRPNPALKVSIRLVQPWYMLCVPAIRRFVRKRD